MSLIPPVTGPFGPTLGALRPERGQLSVAPAPRADATASTDSLSAAHESVAEVLLRDALKAVVDHARMLDWIEQIESTETPSAWLILRPAPDGDRPTHPSPMGAYREISELVNAL